MQNGNPFLDIINQQGQQGQPDMGGLGMGMAEQLSQPQAQEQQSQPVVDAQGKIIPPAPDISQRGTGDPQTRPLIQAMSSLENFVSASDDRTTIMIVKRILEVLGSLLVKQESSGAQALGQRQA